MAERFSGHDAPEGLTPIPARIHSATTPEEVQQLQITAFIDAIADVALSVAARNIAAREPGAAA